ncbi:hypothetical protein HDV00_007520 [Rhizophlyctis rosea]|nr:hypothetical protein HDV00_007520 [Rhizophlyctis rosea]
MTPTHFTPLILTLLASLTPTLATNYFLSPHVPIKCDPHFGPTFNVANGTANPATGAGLAVEDYLARSFWDVARAENSCTNIPTTGNFTLTTASYYFLSNETHLTQYGCSQWNCTGTCGPYGAFSVTRTPKEVYQNCDSKSRRVDYFWITKTDTAGVGKLRPYGESNPDSTTGPTFDNTIKEYIYEQSFNTSDPTCSKDPDTVSVRPFFRTCTLATDGTGFYRMDVMTNSTITAKACVDAQCTNCRPTEPGWNFTLANCRASTSPVDGKVSGYYKTEIRTNDGAGTTGAGSGGGSVGLSVGLMSVGLAVLSALVAM